MYTQENSIVLREVLGKEVGSQIIRTKFFDYIKVENSCWPKVMFNLNVNVNQIEEFLEFVKAGIESGVYPEVLVTELKEQGNEILSNLSRRDIKFGHWSVMQHDLINLTPLNPAKELNIERVETSEQLGHWMRINEKELMKGEMDECLFKSKLNDENILLFLGNYKSKPVATSLVFIQGKESGLYFISTDSDFRRNGFGEEMTLHGLLTAKGKGCTIMNLEATDLGLPVYEKVGFKNYGAVNLINFNKRAI